MVVVSKGVIIETMNERVVVLSKRAAGGERVVVGVRIAVSERVVGVLGMVA